MNKSIEKVVIRVFVLIVSALMFLNCSKSTPTDVYQTERDNVVSVKKMVKGIDIGNVYVNNWSVPLFLDKYFLISDPRAMDDVFHLFDRNTFKHIVSFGRIGQGPKEVTTLGDVSWVDDKRELLVTDLGKNQVLGFCLDSVLNNGNSEPFVKYCLDGSEIPFNSFYKNDSLSFSKVMIPLSDVTHHQTTAVVNYKSGEIKHLDYDREEFFKKRFYLAVSFEDSIYAECNLIFDIISFFDLDGGLIKNVYGPLWGTDYMECYCGAVFTKKYLFTIFNGEEYEEHIVPTQCVVFSKRGDYIATLEVGYNITSVCYDDINDRVVFAFDDVIQFGYLDLKDIEQINN